MAKLKENSTILKHTGEEIIATEESVDRKLLSKADKDYVDTHKAENVSEDAHGWDSLPRFFIGQFTRLTTLDSGNQAITGLGFKPKAVIFYATVQSTSISTGRFSQGFDNGVIRNCYWRYSDIQSINNVLSILIRQGSSSSTQYTGRILSFDQDGFTVQWTKGAEIIDDETITVNYIAFR